MLELTSFLTLPPSQVFDCFAKILCVYIVNKTGQWDNRGMNEARLKPEAVTSVAQQHSVPMHVFYTKVGESQPKL